MRNLTLFLMMMSVSLNVFAQEAKAAEPSFFETMIPFAVMFFIFYFLMIRPQVKKQKSQQDFLQTLKKGDRVLTTGGIFGTIEGLTEQYVTLAVDNKVNIRVLKSHVSQPVKEG